MPSTVYHICRHDGRSPDAGYAGRDDDAPDGATHAASPARNARPTHGSSTSPDDGRSPTGPQHAWNETGMRQMSAMLIKVICIYNRPLMLMLTIANIIFLETPSNDG